MSHAAGCNSVARRRLTRCLGASFIRTPWSFCHAIAAPRVWCGLTVAVLTGVFTSSARADPPQPDGYEGRSRLSDDDLARKRNGHYFTGLPLANYDPNTGLGAGARVYFYENGGRDAPTFSYKPYDHRVFLQGFATTKGVQFHWLDYDAPGVFGSLFRVRAFAIYERQNSRNYYGLGKESLRPLTFPGAGGRTFARMADYEAAELVVGQDGAASTFYDKHSFERPVVSLALERSLFGGLSRAFVGVSASHAKVGDWTGELVRAETADGQETRAPEAPTRLHLDCARGVVVGCRGGWDNTIRLAVSLDTRDYEPDPNSGVFVDAVTDVGTRVVGSQFGYVRETLAARVYWSPFPRLADVVVAGRAAALVQSKGTPFFLMDIFPFTEDTRAGLGGVRTLRGFAQDRFVGHVMTMANLELRWTFAGTRLAGQRFDFGVVPFVDVGRPFDAVREASLRGWRRGQGLGARIAWNLATILMVDYAVSDEGTALYINFNHMF